MLVGSLGCKCIYPLSHLSGPLLTFISGHQLLVVEPRTLLSLSECIQHASVCKHLGNGRNLLPTEARRLLQNQRLQSSVSWSKRH